MPLLSDVSIGALGDDSQEQIKSVVKQINEQGRLISNENLTKLYKDNSGQNRIIIGMLPDGDSGLVISKEGIDVLDVFS